MKPREGFLPLQLRRLARARSLRRMDGLRVLALERELSAEVARHQKVKQRPQLEGVVLERGAREDQPPCSAQPLGSTRDLCLGVANDVSFIEYGVLPAHLHSNGTQAALREQSENTQRALREHSESTQRALRPGIRPGSHPLIAYLCQLVDVSSECLVGHHHKLRLMHSREQTRALLGTSPVLEHMEPFGAAEFGRLGAPVGGEGGRADNDGGEIRWEIRWEIRSEIRAA